MSGDTTTGAPASWDRQGTATPDSWRPSIAQAAGEISIAGVALLADCGGALYWADEGVLVVADLHLEKGSSFAERGVLLPPYDTAATLARLAQVLARYAPRAVIALGDSFHDGEGPARLADTDRAALGELQRGRDWLWIAGNHDSEPVAGVGGTPAAALAIGALTFRHQPTQIDTIQITARPGEGGDPGPKSGNSEQAALDSRLRGNERREGLSNSIPHDGEIAGHLHPVARVNGRGRTVSRRCFASDGRRLVMPAFGAYAGGLNVRDRAFAQIFGTLTFTAHMLGEARLYAISAKRCLPD